MIIGLTGLKGCGKDLVGSYLVKEHSFQRRAFADPVKQSFAAFLGIPLWDIENFKNDPNVFIAVGYKNDPQILSKYIKEAIPAGEPVSFDTSQPNHMWSPIVEYTFREGLQRYPTEGHRDLPIFGDDFWVDLTLPVGGYYGGRAIVVTDCRFISEAERITDLGGYIVRVERPSLEVSPHRSETEQAEIVPHYKLVNDSSVELLYNEVEKMLNFFAEDGV